MENSYTELPEISLQIIKIRIFSCFPIQDFISEHYGEEGVLFEKEIKEFMELRQVGVPWLPKCGLSRIAPWRCHISFCGGPLILSPDSIIILIFQGAAFPGSTLDSGFRFQNVRDCSGIVHFPCPQCPADLQMSSNKICSTVIIYEY